MAWYGTLWEWLTSVRWYRKSDDELVLDVFPPSTPSVLDYQGKKVLVEHRLEETVIVGYLVQDQSADEINDCDWVDVHLILDGAARKELSDIVCSRKPVRFLER